MIAATVPRTAPPRPPAAGPRGRRIAGIALAALAALPFAAAGDARAAAPLPRLAIDPAQVSVSGLSAGGYMAVQLHVAYSSTFRAGAGVVAGGPYGCAEGSVRLATGRCTAGPGDIPVARLAEATERRAREGRIDPTAGLAGARVYLFSGQRDSVVRPAVVDALDAYYRRYVAPANLAYRRDVPAEHAMVTDDYGAGCATKAAPYLNDCDLDLAGAMLGHLHGTRGSPAPLAPRNDGPPAGRLLEFDQAAFVRGHGMAATGQLYLPASCEPAGGAPSGAAPAACRLHVALHGCRQNTAEAGLRYVRHAGYNRWADTNRIVVLYPQTGAGAVNGCWDWWGYDSADHAVRDGPQMAAIKAMADRLMGIAPTRPAPACITASNYAHTAAGRAHARYGFAYANGSNDAMGWWTIFNRSTLKETAPGHFAVQDCPGAARS